MPADPASRLLAGCTVADIRKTAEDAPEPYRTQLKTLLDVIDQQQKLLEQAQADARTAIGGAA